MIWSYQPHRACNPFFKLSQIVGYSGDWIDSICFDPGFIGLVLKNYRCWRMLVHCTQPADTINLITSGKTNQTRTHIL